MSDLDFYFDPVCPFAWMTSKWVRVVADEVGLDVGWRFISLRLLNADKDYTTHFPAGYEEGHTTGLRLLRVADAVRTAHGPSSVGAYYEAVGAAIFESGRGAQRRAQADLPAFTSELLVRLGLDAGLVAALDDASHDRVVGEETERALTLTGRDVGTPILHFGPPDGTAFFGPVISRLPDRSQAVELWRHVEGLATFAGFAELKRSLREVPQLPAFGIEADGVGAEQDWHQGRRPDAMGG